VNLGGRETVLRHVLVAFDLSAHARAALEAAAALAARAGGEIEGLFVEDEEFLKLAGLPVARFVDPGSAAPRPHSVAAMERELRRLAEGARRAIEEVARRTRVRWSFRVVRGPVSPTVLAGAVGADLVALGRSGYEAHAGRRLGSTARAIARAAPMPVLLLRRGETVAPPILVAYDGGEAADRALDLAARLAGPEPVGVLLVPGERRDADVLRRRAEARLRVGGTTARVRVVEPPALADAVRDERGGVLLLPAAPGSSLAERVDEVACPVLLVR